MNQNDKLEQITISMLNESINTDKILNEIEFTKNY